MIAFTFERQYVACKIKVNMKKPNVGPVHISASSRMRPCKPRLLIAHAGYVDDVGAFVRVPADVRRLLGNLLSLRCRCDVRIDGDETYNRPRAADGSDDNDQKRSDCSRGPTAFVVIHSKPPPRDDNGFHQWLNEVDWRRVLTQSSAGVWLGLESNAVEYGDNVICHIYFRLSDDNVARSDK